MQHDEMIWQVINHQFCSYKTTIGAAKSDNQAVFCRHPYSITGLCNRSTCPLANSRYATIREENGRVNLYIKTVERAHTPKNLWEKIHLSRNYGKALSQLDEHLAYFPKVLVHRNKQRLTKIHQYLIRMRKIKLKQLAGQKAKLVRVHRKIDQREERREKKALVAAKVEQRIEEELLERLKKGTYGDIYNFPEVPYQKALEAVEEKQMQDEEEEEEEEESESEEEVEEEGVVEYVEDLEEEEEEYEETSDMEDMEYLGNGQWGSGESESEDEVEEEESGEDEEGEGASDEDEDDGESSSDEDGSSSDDDAEDRKEGATKKKAEDQSKRKRQHPRRRLGTRIEIEYEEETEPTVQHETVAGMAW